MDEDDLIQKKSTPQEALEAEKLDTLSVAELEERIKILKSEIVRTEKMLAAKEDSKKAADAVFSKK